ncbi:MAG: hypothetical protein AAF441_07090 [Pseudomonadota bacterium]
MTTLANTPSAAANDALHSGIGSLVESIKVVFASLARAIEFSRRCEAEFSRTGRISPATLDLLAKQA